MSVHLTSACLLAVTIEMITFYEQVHSYETALLSWLLLRTINQYLLTNYIQEFNCAVV